MISGYAQDYQKVRYQYRLTEGRNLTDDGFRTVPQNWFTLVVAHLVKCGFVGHSQLFL